jgi:hypothetical protein
MKTLNTEAENDELRTEYDLTQLQVRKRGPGRREGIEIYLEPDVARVFPNSTAVNEALRFLIRVTQNFHGS